MIANRLHRDTGSAQCGKLCEQGSPFSDLFFYFYSLSAQCLCFEVKSCMHSTFFTCCSCVLFCENATHLKEYLCGKQ